VKRKRKKADEANPRWWEALHKAQDWDEQGLSHARIAKRLNAEGYSLGRGKGLHFWTDTAVTRALDKHPKHPVEYPVKWIGEDVEDPNSTIEIIRFKDDGTPKQQQVFTAHHPQEFPGDTDAERQAAYEAFKREIARQAYVPLDRSKQPKRTYPELKPRDWTTESETMTTLDWVNTWVAGQDDWDRDIVPMVAEHSRALAWGFLDRLDELPGDPVDLAKLRWAYLGLIRRLAMREETVLALKEEIRKLKGER
jgi:hypothetical protein